MERFYFEDNDDDGMEDGMEKYFDMDDLEEAAAIIDASSLKLAEQNENNVMLDRVISFLSASWLWRFRSLDTKLEMISKAYKALDSLTKVQK